MSVNEPVPAALIASGDPCPVCQPIGNVYLDPDGYLSCNNCTWNTEEDRTPEPTAGRVSSEQADRLMERLNRAYMACPDADSDLAVLLMDALLWVRRTAPLVKHAEASSSAGDERV